MIKRVLIKALRIKEIVYCLFFQNKKTFPRKNHGNAFLFLRFLGHAPAKRRRLLRNGAFAFRKNIALVKFRVKGAHNLCNSIKPAKVFQKRPCLEPVFIRQVIVYSERGNEEREYTLRDYIFLRFEAGCGRTRQVR